MDLIFYCHKSNYGRKLEANLQICNETQANNLGGSIRQAKVTKRNPSAKFVENDQKTKHLRRL